MTMNRKRWLITGVSLMAVVLVLSLAGCQSTRDIPGQVTAGNIILSQQNTGIWVTGQGEITVVPDVAVLSLGVEVQAETVAQAQDEAAKSMETVMQVLEDNGVDEKDIKTQQFNIYPVRNWRDDEQIIIGYRVTNTVTVKIREVENTGVIIDGVAEAGGDYTVINSISFTVDEPEEYYAEVRELAMADALETAEQLAALSGVSLGKPTYINESSVSPIYRNYYYDKAGAAVPEEATTPISAGEMDVSLTVQVVYSIK
jgi:uncharacterized protein YggE